MPKLQNVTEAELKELMIRVDELLGDLHGINSRMEKNYLDDLVEPVAKARMLNGLARASSEMVSHILHRSAMQEMQRETEAMLRLRMKVE